MSTLGFHIVKVFPTSFAFQGILDLIASESFIVTGAKTLFTHECKRDSRVYNFVSENQLPRSAVVLCGVGAELHVPPTQRLLVSVLPSGRAIGAPNQSGALTARELLSLQKPRSGQGNAHRWKSLFSFLLQMNLSEGKING